MALVTRIIMKSVTNNTKVLQVYFDASNTSQTLKPGETRMISAVVSEEVPRMDELLKQIDALKRENAKLATTNIRVPNIGVRAEAPIKQQVAKTSKKR